ncbi:protein mono-ADP-ribosyltransferase PARP14-like [Pholidichthys leucotaenia]
MDDYQYPLFFEAKELADREKEKLRRYFQKRRESGGGECGHVEKIGDRIYTVCFKEKDDQERVLQRKFHTLSLPDGDQRLTVSRTVPTQTPDQSPAITPPDQTQATPKSDTKSLEKKILLDIFLMYYLRDNPKAFRVLQKQLTSIGCTVELNFDEEEAVVKGDVEKMLGGAFRGTAENWERQVDRIFASVTESYQCHHVMEPKHIKILLQDLSFATYDLKVYTERGYAVVVGEADAVNERIAILEKSLPTQKQLPVVEKQFKLVEDEFSQEMRRHYPEVKIIRSTAMIILEGPDNEVQSGAAKLDELIKNIKQKRLKFATDVLTFLKNSGAISKYQARFQQNFRNPILFELESDLVLSSLSPDVLEEAGAALQRDLKVDTVPLQEAAAVSPALDKLKEILTKAKNEANLNEIRVDISFIPRLAGTKVKLVGYSDSVNKLTKVLHDFQMNHVVIQELLLLPNPELIDIFDEMLALIGIKQTNVTLKPSPFPSPCILLSGTRCLVQEVKQTLSLALAKLTSDTLTFDGPGAQKFFQGQGKVSKELLEKSSHVLIREKQSVFQSLLNTKLRSLSLSTSTTTPPLSRRRFDTVGSVAVNGPNLRINIGSLEDEQVNALVAPMLNHKLTSTKIGSGLLNKAGNTLKSKFQESLATNSIIHPGEILQVHAPPSLGCSKIFFIECLPWDGVRGPSVQALSKGLKTCLDLCVQMNLNSVAFPLTGLGIILKYPVREAIQVLTETILQFGLSASSGSLHTIHIVIKPGYPNSEECYRDVYKQLSSKMNQRGQAIFRSLTGGLDDVVMTVGRGIRLELVFGDITNETTDVVVNTTDFVNLHNEGVCNDILTVAGPEVEAELKAAHVNKGDVIKTQPGQFPCEALFHVCGERDSGLIEQLVVDIIRDCESFQCTSVAIPAICAGEGGLEPGVVAGAILQGIKAATTYTPLDNLTHIRVVLFKINVFLAFKEEAMQMFSTVVINKVPFHVPSVQQQQQLPPLTATSDLSLLHINSAAQKSVFTILGHSKESVATATAKLKELYETQCSSQLFTKDKLEGLTQDDMDDMKQLVEEEGLYVEKDQSGSLTVSGLKDGVNQVAKMINEALHKNLKRKVRDKEEEDLYGRVSWCILGHSGEWERLPKTANHKLENKDVLAGIVNAQGTLWRVDLQNMEATSNTARQTVKLKRLENCEDFTFPLYWDSMVADLQMLSVALDPSSAEYKTVKEGFKRTVHKTVLKIERVQNIHLRRAYEARKKQISDKRAQEGGAGEQFLYHGTTQENCTSIMNTGFDRRFAGQNATSYGIGTYFAVNASYSAHPTYSKPATDGCQLMFVARVLIGVYTQGLSDMKVPPLRNNQNPHDRFDSVVDKPNNPNMYVVFHDNQAYPDYLITFK